MSGLQSYLETCEEAVRAAGATIRGWIGKTSVQHKGPADFVTEADFAAQEVVTTTVLHAFPHHSVLGEEDQLAGDTPSNTEYRWIVDPLDGTTNFVHGIPHYAVSLALEHRGEVLVGAIFDPSLNECFTAASGRGAFLNGRPIRTNGANRLSEVLAGTGFPAKLQPDSPDLLVFNKALFRCQGIRRTGSASLNMCDVAAGRFGVLWGFSTKIWDIAAGVLLIQEAGGIVTSPEGGELNLGSGRFLAAANRDLHKQMLELVREAV
ncbi:MAG: inositol monophosphatase family protein [Thermoguttaceae bacterium]|jgi:myo-inositol-1(or 4)-monophosphatase